MRKTIRCVCALIASPVLLFFIPLMWFLDWLYEYPSESAQVAFKGWKNWVTFR